jgi:acyl-ACP thioesterase
MKKNVIWVITKMKYRYLMPLMPDTDYILATYPRPNGSLMYQRDFYISDSAGNKLVIASSEWCHINFVTRRIEQLALTYDGEYFTENAFPEGIERIRPKGLELAGSHVVESCDLDANQHTNNRRYADMGLDILGKTNIHELNITFSKETRLGDEIKLFASPDRSTAAGKLPDGALIFAMTVK